MDKIHRRVALRIRQLAEERDLALTHLADRCGTSRSHFWEVLGGRSSPTLRWLCTVARELDVPVEELLREARH